MRIHIFGAAGTGTTTLGKGLSGALEMRHLDSDEFYWKKTEIPYTQKETANARVESIRNTVVDTDRWILSGSMCSWGDSLISEFTHMIYLTAEWGLRRERLVKRQADRFGLEALRKGGKMHQVHRDFIEWASRYDTAGLEQRSKATHEAWITALPSNIRVIRIDGSLPQEKVLSLSIDQINSNKTAHTNPLPRSESKF